MQKTSRFYIQGETQAASLTQAGLAYPEAGNDQLAEGLLRQAATLMPNESQPYEYLIKRVYTQEKNFDRAVLALRKALEIAPGSATAFFTLGAAEVRGAHYG